MNTVMLNEEILVENFKSENNFLSKNLTCFGVISSEIDVKRLKIGKIIGSGTSGVVAAAYDPSSKKIYAVKKINKKENHSDKDVVRKELEFARSLKHENIPKVYDTYTSVNSGYIIMKLCVNGCLFDYIKNNFPFKKSQLKYFTRQMVSAVKYLHDHKIAHQDIKSRNFLLDENLMIKLCDFGLTEKYSDDSSEQIEKLKNYSTERVLNPIKIDIWELGITFFEMATSDIPNKCHIFRSLVNSEGKFQITCPKMVLKSLSDLIENMLVFDEDKRLDINGVDNHIWFADDLKTYYKITGKTELFGLIATDAISTLQEFDYFCERNKNKSSVFFVMKAKIPLLIQLLQEVFKDQQINYELKGMKFKCTTTVKCPLFFSIDIKSNLYQKSKSTIKFLKLKGSQVEFLVLLRKIVNCFYL